MSSLFHGSGTRTVPQCGFSATVVNILDEHLPEYQTVDVLSDPALRDGIKEFELAYDPAALRPRRVHRRL